MRYLPSNHRCVDHIVRRILPKSGGTFTSGGVPVHVCSVCNRPVVMRFGPRDVLMRAQPKAMLQ
jgi:hypothetical protein